jgi:hypothetical protein
VYVDRYAAGRFLRIYVREHAIGTTSPSPGRDLILWLRFATVPSIILANPPASIAQRNQRPTLFQQSELASHDPPHWLKVCLRIGGRRNWARVLLPHTTHWYPLRPVPRIASIEIRTGQPSLGAPTKLHGSKSGQSGRATRTPRTLSVGVANSSGGPQMVPKDSQGARGATVRRFARAIRIDTLRQSSPSIAALVIPVAQRLDPLFLPTVNPRPQAPSILPFRRHAPTSTQFSHLLR